MHQSPFPCGLDRLMSVNTPVGEAASMAIFGTIAGFAMGALLAQEQQAQAQQPPSQSRNPYRNNREIATVADLECWVLENEARLPNARIVLRHLADMPEQARLDQQTVRNLLTASR